MWLGRHEAPLREGQRATGDGRRAKGKGQRARDSGTLKNALEASPLGDGITGAR
jgi:hypothetical protein